MSYYDGKHEPSRRPILEGADGLELEILGTGTCGDFKKIFSLPDGRTKNNDVIPNPQSHNWTCKFPIQSYGKGQKQGILLVSNNKMCDFGVQYQFIDMDMSDVGKPDNSIPSTIHP